MARVLCSMWVRLGRLASRDEAEGSSSVQDFTLPIASASVARGTGRPISPPLDFSPLDDLRASYVKKQKITSARRLRYASAAWR